jgi:uncharacterized membrane protein YhdT
MLILKIGRVLNIILLTTLLYLLLWFFVEAYINGTPENYVFLFYPSFIEILIPLLGIALLLITFKHIKKTYHDISIFYFLIPALVFIGVLLGKIGTIVAVCVILGSIIIQTKKSFQPNKLS